jgi:hypothetical protein
MVKERLTENSIVSGCRFSTQDNFSPRDCFRPYHPNERVRAHVSGETHKSGKDMRGSKSGSAIQNDNFPETLFLKRTAMGAV